MKKDDVEITGCGVPCSEIEKSIQKNTDEILNACKRIADEALALKEEGIKRLEEELQNIDRVKELENYINECRKNIARLQSSVVKNMQYTVTIDGILDRLDKIKPSYKYEELWKGLYRYNDNYKDNNQLKKSMAKLIVKCMDALEKEWMERQNLQKKKENLKEEKLFERKE